MFHDPKVEESVKDSIYTNLFISYDGKSFYSHLKSNIRSEIDIFFSNPFNKNWICPINQVEIFVPFAINVISHQLDHSYHPLTCGTNSEHYYLVPRLTEDSKLLLVCPTCGYLQMHQIYIRNYL
jgi:hypothetical protein